MKIVSTSYVNTSEFSDPLAWLDRISFHTGILEELAQNHEVNSIEQINYSGKLIRKKVTYHFVNYKKPRLYFPIQLHSYIKQLNPDIVWIHGFIFPAQLIQLKWLLGNKVKIVVQNHAEKPFSGWRKFLQQKADRHVGAYFFTSAEMGLEWVGRSIISNTAKIVEVMESSSTFKQMDRTNARSITNVSGDPVFLWVGRLNANKDPLAVVKTFLEFIFCRPSAKLYMIYHTEELLYDIEKLIANAKENIQLVGRIPHGELQAWYNSADFIISGSHYEGSGVAVCEAMSCGCIPILTNIASFRKMTGNGQCGLVYEPGNREQLLSALLQTASMDINTERERTLFQFNKELSFEAIAGKMNETITSLATNV